MRTKLFNLFKILVSAGLLAYLLFFKTDLSQLWQIAKQAEIGYLIAASLIMVIGTIIRAFRWQVLLEALDIHIPLKRLIELYFIGAFFNIFMPSGVGGDAIKMVELTRSTGKGPESIGTTLVDRALGLWVLFIIALISLPFGASMLPAQWIPWIAIFAVGGVVGGWLVMGTPIIPWIGKRIRLPGQEKLERFYRSVSSLGYPALGKASLVSLVFNLLLIVFNYLTALGMGVKLPIGVFVLFTPIISFSLALPISVGGLGVREQTYEWLFGALGIGSATSIALSLANYLITNLVVGLIGGVIYALEGTRGLVKSPQKEE